MSNQNLCETARNDEFFFLHAKTFGIINWDDYFMATACLAARRSKDPVRQVGACIVNSDNIIVGVGYNGFPRGCNDDQFSWAKHAPDNKFLYVCHAEVNAILNKNSSDIKGCIMYVVLFPCNDCAKMIIQAGISVVIFLMDTNQNKPENKAARKMFDAAGVAYRKFEYKNSKITIDFEQIILEKELGLASPLTKRKCP